MGLSCSCSDDYDWYYRPRDDYEPLNRKRRQRCCSCKSLINIGDLVLALDRERPPSSDIEERIYGCESVPLATWYMCEICADLFLSLDELGFCVAIGLDDMRELVREYAEGRRSDRITAI